MLIKFKKLNKNASAPRQGSGGAAAFDLTATRIETDYKAQTVTIHSDIAVEIPAGHVGLLFPRSSVCKTALRLTNCVGVIDSDYRGEVTAVFDYTTRMGKIYEVGDRFAQLMIVALPHVVWHESKTLTQTERGIGGYGSTGR